MTKEEVIKMLEGIRKSTPPPLENQIEALSIAITALENEPAPAEADTSSNNNNSLQHNDTAKLRICQDVIDKIAKCSSDAWARGYCQAAIDVMEAGGEYAEV